jgi:hypothetical protein
VKQLGGSIKIDLNIFLTRNWSPSCCLEWLILKKKTTVSVLFVVMTNGKLWLDDSVCRKNGKGKRKKKTAFSSLQTSPVLGTSFFSGNN